MILSHEKIKKIKLRGKDNSFNISNTVVIWCEWNPKVKLITVTRNGEREGSVYNGLMGVM